eukprot:scaffold26413_cov138-Isochrysis_galbana.AAC.2
MLINTPAPAPWDSGLTRVRLGDWGGGASSYPARTLLMGVSGRACLGLSVCALSLYCLCTMRRYRRPSACARPSCDDGVALAAGQLLLAVIAPSSNILRRGVLPR